MQPKLTFRDGELRQISKKVTPIRDRRRLIQVTGRKAKFFPAPKELCIARVASMVGLVIAEALWEMCQAYTEHGFGEAGEAEYLNNTKEVRNFFSVLISSAGCAPP
jgi:hypothetical protein